MKLKLLGLSFLITIILTLCSGLSIWILACWLPKQNPMTVGIIFTVIGILGITLGIYCILQGVRNIHPYADPVDPLDR